MDIVEFLNARLDDDEQAAKAAGSASWTDYVPGMVHVDPKAIADDKHAFGNQGHIASAEHAEIRAHIARHDPARVLREIATKRAILAAYSEHADLDTEDPETEYAYGHARGLGLAARHMAAIWSNHPDYDPAWAPVT